MGLFDFIGDIGTAIAKPFRDATGISASPQGVSFGTPFQHFGLGDAMSLASGFGGAGFVPTKISDLGQLGTANLGLNSLASSAGFGDPSQWTIKDTPRLLGLLGSSGAFGGQGGGGFGGNAGGASYDSQRLGALNNAFHAADPANNTQTIANYGANAQRRARERGRLNAATLRAKGYGSGAQAGAEIGASNAANEATNQFAMNLSDPNQRASQYLRQANIYSPQNVYAGDLFNAHMQMLGNQIAASRPKSQFEQLLDLASHYGANGGYGTGMPNYGGYTPGYVPSTTDYNPVFDALDQMGWFGS